MTGWISKKKIAQNALYGPISSPLKQTKTWRENLLSWEREATTRYLIIGSSGSASEDIISDCMDKMQEQYPGKYILEWKDVVPNEYHLVIAFPDAKHESMWNLKYGTS
jgi:hypothetical protein